MKKKFWVFQQGGGKSYAYADADTLPEISPSTEREGESPANKYMT